MEADLWVFVKNRCHHRYSLVEVSLADILYREIRKAMTLKYRGGCSSFGSSVRMGSRQRQTDMAQKSDILCLQLFKRIINSPYKKSQREFVFQYTP